MSEFDFSADWDADGHDAPVSDGSEGLGTLDHQDLGLDADYFGHDADIPEFGDLNDDDGFGGHGAYDLVGADPDEEGLWDQLMLDMTDDVNPYVAN